MKTRQIAQRAIDSLTPFPGNARTHSAEQIAAIAASLTEFGWTNPVLIDPDGGIIAGHGRVEAAKTLGIDKVPTITLTDLTPAQMRAYVIADNKLALNAGWDDALLRIEMEELRDAGFDIGLIGFGEDELNMLFNGWNSTIEPPGEGSEGDDTVGKIVITCAAEERDSLLALIKDATKDGEYRGLAFK